MALLQFGQVARELLLLTAAFGDVGFQAIDLALQIEQRAAQLGVFFAQGLDAVVAAFKPLAQIEDGATRLIVFEQARLRSPQRQSQQACQCQALRE